MELRRNSAAESNVCIKLPPFIFYMSYHSLQTLTLCLLVISVDNQIANSLDPDQAQHFVCPLYVTSGEIMIKTFHKKTMLNENL